MTSSATSLFACILGASKFRDPQLIMPELAAAKDQWLSYLQGPLGIQADHILDLFDSHDGEGAQVAKIQGLLTTARTSAPAGTRSTLLMYYLGHGYRQDGMYYWLVRESDTSTAHPTDAVKVPTLMEIIEKSSVDVAIFVDACFARSTLEALQYSVSRSHTCLILCPVGSAEAAGVHPANGTVLMAAIASVLGGHSESDPPLSPKDLCNRVVKHLKPSYSAFFDILGNGDRWGEGLFPALGARAPQLSPHSSKFLTTAHRLGLLTRFQAQHISTEASMVGSFRRRPLCGQVAISLGYMSPRDVERALASQHLAPSQQIDVLAGRFGRRAYLYGASLAAPVIAFWWLNDWRWAALCLAGWLSLMVLLDPEEPQRPISRHLGWPSVIRALTVVAWLATGAWTALALNDHLAQPLEPVADGGDLAAAMASWSLLGASLVAMAVWRRRALLRLRRYMYWTRELSVAIPDERGGSAHAVMDNIARALESNRWIRVIHAILSILGGATRAVTLGRFGRSIDFKAVNVVLTTPRNGELRVHSWRCRTSEHLGDITEQLKERVTRPITDIDWFDNHKHVGLKKFLEIEGRARKVSLVGSAFAYRRTIVMEDASKCWSYANVFLDAVRDHSSYQEAQSAMLIRSGVAIPIPPCCSRSEDQLGVLAVYRNVRNGLSREDIDIALIGARALYSILSKETSRDNNPTRKADPA